MAKNAINFTGIIPETGDSFKSATQNTTVSLDGIDAKLGILDSTKAAKGIAYIKNEGGIKVVQGVPTGGQKSFIGNQTGAIKIKFPTDQILGRIFDSFKVFIQENNGGSTILEVTGFTEGLLQDNIQTFSVSVIKDRAFNKKVYFCNGATDDYILIGETTDTWEIRQFVVSDVKYNKIDGSNVDWSTGWDISIVTTLENLDSIKKVTITPSLNATHINGTMASNAQGGLTQKKSSTSALNVQNDVGESFFNVDTINNKFKLGTCISISKEVELQASQTFDLSILDSYVGNLYVNATSIENATSRTSKIYNASDRFGEGGSIVETYTVNGIMGGIAFTVAQINTGGLNNVIRFTNSSTSGVKFNVAFVGAKGF